MAITKRRLGRTTTALLVLVSVLTALSPGMALTTEAGQSAPTAGSSNEGGDQQDSDQPASLVVAQPTPDERTFSQTRFRIDNDAFWQYFTQYGGADTIGYPSSRQFRLLGCQMQIFTVLIFAAVRRRTNEHSAGDGPGVSHRHILQWPESPAS